MDKWRFRKPPMGVEYGSEEWMDYIEEKAKDFYTYQEERMKEYEENSWTHPRTQ